MRLRRPSSGTAALAGALALATVLAAGCHDPFDADFTGAVITVVDSGPPLQSAITFALPDTIVELQGSTFQLDHVNDDAITANIRNQLRSLGWVDVSGDTTVRPDVVVLVAATTRIQTGVVYGDWYGAWGYLPYWGPAVTDAWAWGAPVGAVPYAFPAGTLVIAMLDLRNFRPQEQEIPLLWAAAIDGVIRGASAAADRAQVGIDQAFDQSEYLARTP